MLLLMQLFLVDQRTRKGDQIFLTDIPEILSQLRKVLRMKKGDVFWLQQKTGASARYQIQICERTDTSLSGKLIQTQTAPPSCPAVEMLIALPNKREKAEWVTQKLTEIGIKKLFFWPAERSVIKVWNAHKAQRLRKIAQEALEQSRGWELPQIAFLSVQDLSCLESSSVFFFDQDEKASCSALTLSPQVFSAQQGVRGIIGPEG